MSIFVLAALLVYLGSHIPRAISLPADDLSGRTTTRIKEEQIIIRNPQIAEGDVALSYIGNKNEVADIWLTNATLDHQSQHLLFPGSASPGPDSISYTGNDPILKGSDDTCHTAIEIRRAKGSGPVDALKLYQSDETAGPQRFRQLILDPGSATMEIEAHTDSPTQGAINLSDCRKILTIGGHPPIDLPAIPVHMLVHGGRIDLHFSPANPALPIYTNQEQTFEAVSLGDNSLRASRLQVVSTEHSMAPLLDVWNPGNNITLSHLELGARMLKLNIGLLGERAVAYSQGRSIYNYDLIDAIQKNPILGFAFAAVLVPAFWKWVAKNCFPESVKGGAQRGGAQQRESRGRDPQ